MKTLFICYNAIKGDTVRNSGPIRSPVIQIY